MELKSAVKLNKQMAPVDTKIVFSKCSVLKVQFSLPLKIFTAEFLQFCDFLELYIQYTGHLQKAESH